MQQISELAQNTTQPLMMTWIQNDQGDRPALIGYLDAIISDGLQLRECKPCCPNRSRAVHGDSKCLFNRWNLKK